MSLATLLAKHVRLGGILLDDGVNGTPARANTAGDLVTTLNALTSETGAIHTLTAQGVATLNSADLTNEKARGLHLVIDITAITGTGPSLTVTIEAKDPTSGKYYTLLQSAALAAAATTVLKVFPGAAVTANLSANDVLPRTYRVKAVVAGTTPAVTATIAANLVP